MASRLSIKIAMNFSIMIRLGDVEPGLGYRATTYSLVKHWNGFFFFFFSFFFRGNDDGSYTYLKREREGSN